jgi:hypothetical protein
VKNALQAIHFSMDLTVTFVLEKHFGIKLQKSVKNVSKEQNSINYKTNVIVRMRALTKLTINYALPAHLPNISI